LPTEGFPEVFAVFPNYGDFPKAASPHFLLGEVQPVLCGLGVGPGRQLHTLP